MKKEKPFEDSIFQLSTGEKVNAADLEKLIGDTCHYVKYVMVREDEKGNPAALIFPNKNLLENPDYKLTPDEGCFCPRSLEELGRCLTGCLKLVNNKMDGDALKIKSAAIINEDSSENIIKKYKTLLRETHGDKIPAGEEIYFIKNI